VQPNGNIVVPVIGFSRVGFFISVFSSSDGGASWSSARQITPVKFHNPAGGIRADIPLPSAEIDASGRIYVVWSDCRFEKQCTAGDIVLITSSDGQNWSRPTRIPLDPIGSGVDHFLPGLAVNRDTSGNSAQLALTFYFYPNASCTPSTCQLDVGSSTSSDGGASWTANAQLAGPMTLSWLPNTSQGRMVADYISTSFVAGHAFPSFAVASSPTSGGSDCATATPNCNQPIFTARGGLSSSAAIRATDTDTSTQSVTPTTGSATAQ
jgi:hypothetical protein